MNIYMKATRPKRGIIPRMTKAQTAFAEILAEAVKIERGINLSAARRYTKLMRNYQTEFIEPLIVMGRTAIADINGRKFVKCSPAKLKAITNAREKRKQNLLNKNNHGI